MPDLSNLDLSTLIPFEQIVFWAMTLCTLGGGLGVVSSKSLFHSALYLALSLFGVAGYYVLLSAGFLAVVQLLVYIGAIVILVLFAIMFSRRLMKSSETTRNQQWWLAALVGLALVGVLFGVVNTIEWPVSTSEPAGDTVLQLGLAFLGSYLIPFLVVSIVLSVALIGGIILARERIPAEEVN